MTNMYPGMFFGEATYPSVLWCSISVFVCLFVLVFIRLPQQNHMVILKIENALPKLIAVDLTSRNSINFPLNLNTSASIVPESNQVGKENIVCVCACV